MKRREVEDKLREKLKAQTEEIDERIKMEDENVNLRRRVEQRVFDERAVGFPSFFFCWAGMFVVVRLGWGRGMQRTRWRRGFWLTRGSLQMQIRHENLLSQAYMLCTNSTPKLVGIASRARGGFCF